MADITSYIDGFFGIGSKSTKKANQKELLIRLLSFEAQALTTKQKLQVLTNLDISVDDFGKTGKIALAKGTHSIYFSEAFTNQYSIFAAGSNGSASINVITIDDSNLDHFTIKVPVACTVRWNAKLLTQA